MPPDETHLFAATFRDALNTLKPGWIMREGAVYGPEDAVVRFSERHESDAEGHVDVEFAVSDQDAQAVRLWDCVSGFGATPAERAQSAAHIWASTSGRALLEFKYSRRGLYADHYLGHEPQGLLGWHCICSAVLGYGLGDSAGHLQDWWLTKKTALPAISPTLRSLTGDHPHTIKIFFGAQDTAEVRVDGELHEAASQALQALDWPRVEPAAYLRVFVIAVHRE